MADTDCRKCKAPMAPYDHMQPFVFGSGFKVTAYRCERCGHWNDLKRRKPRAALSPKEQV